jgi:hypothetical protein
MTLSDSSASTSSTLISFEDSFDRCDISAKVFVRSTRESRPSSSDSSRIFKCCREPGVSLVGVLVADSRDGM